MLSSFSVDSALTMDEEEAVASAAVQAMADTARAIRRTTEAGDTTTTTTTTTGITTSSSEHNGWEEELSQMGAGGFLRQHLVKLTDTIEPEDFSRELQQDNVLTARDVELVKSTHTPRMDRAGQLIDVVSRKGPDAVRAFMAILGRKYPYLFSKVTGQKPPSLQAPVLRDSTFMLRDSGFMVSEALRHLTTVVERKVQELQISLAQRTKETLELEEQLRQEQEAARRYRKEALDEKEQRLKVMHEYSSIKRQNKAYAELMRNMHQQLNERKENLADGSDSNCAQIEPEAKRRSIAEIEEKTKEVVDTLEKLENSAQDIEHLQKSLRSEVTRLTRQGGIRNPGVKKEISGEEAPQPVYESSVPCKALYPRPVLFLGERGLCEQLSKELTSLESADFQMSKAPVSLNKDPDQMHAFADYIKQDPHHRILPQMDWTTVQSLRAVKIFPIVIVLNSCLEDKLTKEVADIKANLRPHEYVSTGDLDLTSIKDTIKDIQNRLA